MNVLHYNSSSQSCTRTLLSCNEQHIGIITFEAHMLIARKLRAAMYAADIMGHHYSLTTEQERSCEPRCFCLGLASTAVLADWSAVGNCRQHLRWKWQKGTGSALPCWYKKKSTAIRKATFFETCNHWKSRSNEVMWAYFRSEFPRSHGGQHIRLNSRCWANRQVSLSRNLDASLPERGWKTGSATQRQMLIVWSLLVT